MIGSDYIIDRAQEFVADGGAPAQAYDHARERLGWISSDAMQFVRFVEDLTPGTAKDPVHGYGFYYWRLMIQAHTAGGSDEQLDEGARVALAEGCGAWHAFAVACGNVDRCGCARCSEAREAAKSTGRAS